MWPTMDKSYVFYIMNVLSLATNVTIKHTMMLTYKHDI